MTREFKMPKVRNDMTSYLSSLIKNKKVGLFVDSANLYHSALISGIKIDFAKIYSWFNQKAHLKVANFYSAFDPDDQRQLIFLEDLEFAGYRMVKKPIKIYTSGIKGNMDIEIAVDSILQRDEYDILILISGDGDFHYLVQALEKLNKKTIILSIGGFTSFELHQDADGYFFFNRISKVWQADRETYFKTKAKNRLDSTQKLDKNKADQDLPIIIMDGENNDFVTQKTLESNLNKNEIRKPKNSKNKEQKEFKEKKLKVKVSLRKPKIII